MENHKLKNSQKNVIILLRIVIGWHFLYEGIIKAYNPAWTAKGYLLNARGPFEGLFNWMASDSVIWAIDYLNVFGLVAIGLGLVIGFAERTAAIAGILLLSFYYLAQPPFMGIPQTGMEGNYWVINKNLIEAIALLVIYQIPTAKFFGLERIFMAPKKQKLQNT